MRALRSLFLVGWVSSLIANPHGPSIIAGHASIKENSHELSISTSGRTIINWDSFSIDAGEITRFLQDAPVLNRVLGGDPSRLMGLLEANGEIYLLNPQGILVGRDATIQTAGFIASTLDLDNHTFLAGGKLEFFGDSIASIVHEGTLGASRILEEGGRVFLVSNDLTKVSGSISGSEVRVLGDTVHLNETAQIDAPSGTVLIGGDARGQNPEVKNARLTQIDPGAQISVDGREGEDGGRVIVWADEGTLFAGNISGRGAKGGFVEVSSGDKMLFEGKTDLSSPTGEFGSLLIDPQFIQIVPGGPNPVAGFSLFTDIPAGTAMISGSFALSSAINAGTVTLQANTDITISDTVNGTTSGNGLILQAGRSITINSNITLTNGPFTATINDNGAIAADRLAGPAQFKLNSTISTQGGNVLIGHGSQSGVNEGEVIINGRILAGTGRIDITGDGIPGANLIGIDAHFGILTTSGTGAGAGITLTGNGAPLGASNGNVGVSTEFVTANEGNILITGTGGGLAGTSNNSGIVLSTGRISSTGAGANAAKITLRGTAGNGTDNNYGILDNGNNITADLTTVDGDISLTGIAQGSGANNIGVQIGNMTSTGLGKITIRGTGSSTGANDGCSGVIVLTSGGHIQTVNGDISITGIGGGTPSSSFNLGLQVIGGGIGGGIQSTGVGATAGKITLNGTGGAGTNNNWGIQLPNSHAGITTVDGDISITGRGQGTGTGNIGINHSGAIGSTGIGNISLTGIGGTGTSGNVGIALVGTSVFPVIDTTSSGNITLNGTGNGDGTGSGNSGIAGGAVNSTGVGATAGSITLVGIAGPGTSGDIGIDISSISTVDGNISFTGTGTATVGDIGIHVTNATGANIQSTGIGNISMSSLTNDLVITGGLPLSTASGTMSLLSLNGAANITISANVNCGGAFIAAANNNFTNTGTLTITGNGSIIVDEQSGAAVGPGVFSSTTIMSTSGNLAIYAAQGPQQPASLPPFPSQVNFGNLDPPISTWDMAILFPVPLNAKYDTSYQAGGPYHGPGFGVSYVPGNGVFGSMVVWYKVFALPLVPPFVPIPPGSSVFSIPSLQETLALIDINANVWESYFLKEFLPCPILPCIDCESEEICIPDCCILEGTK